MSGQGIDKILVASLQLPSTVPELDTRLADMEVTDLVCSRSQHLVTMGRLERPLFVGCWECNNLGKRKAGVVYLSPHLCHAERKVLEI